jgi:hypothetical protein
MKRFKGGAQVIKVWESLVYTKSNKKDLSVTEALTLRL